jgi:hypothetical protein
MELGVAGVVETSSGIGASIHAGVRREFASAELVL